MKVSKKFVKEYVEDFRCFGGQIDKGDIVSGKFKMVDSTLSANQITNIKQGYADFESFQILLSGGAGWGTAWLYSENARGIEKEMMKEVEEEIR